jgi:hypothetical protein
MRLILDPDGVPADADRGPRVVPAGARRNRR